VSVEDTNRTAVEEEPVAWEGLHHDVHLHAGRYEIHERIGEGAMGVVHAGFDPQLQRKVAIKFVVPERDAPRARRRLLREAQAMARVKHPNVVGVLDAGEAGGQVFIAMEFVAGTTLAEWANRRPRKWREVVKMFVQAGRGLAAAHAAGLVHRDFKPENVLVDEQGIAHVMDFGLVRPLGESTQGEDLDATPVRPEPLDLDLGLRRGASDTFSDSSLTKTGAVLGTPAYMAPEQGRGKPANPRSDQFSFCVALFEGLYGHRPYEGGSAADVLAAGEAELIPSRRGDIPPRIHAAIRRGLEPDPERRWPNMEALLAELERTRFHVSTAAVVAAGTLVALASVGFVARDRIHAWWSPVTLTVPVTEAEVVEPMQLHGAATGDAYVASTWANKGRLELDVELPTSGRYYLHGLVWEPVLGGDHGDPDSFFVYIDDGEETLWHFGCQNERMPERVLIDNWAWQPVLHMPNADSDCEIDPTLYWDLEAGPHRVVFRNRENAETPEEAARLARVVVTNQVDWRP
jgi:predicted Ser/Thr protein kinase